MAALIEDYALLSDCKGAALVNKQGTIDWLCLPRFDSAACLASLLGSESHGSWAITATGESVSVRRRYIEGTLVLETEFETDQGMYKLTDYMASQTEESILMRSVEVLKGTVKFTSLLSIKFDYGATIPWIQPIRNGFRAIAGPDCIDYFSDQETKIQHQKMLSEFTLAESQIANFQIIWSHTYDPKPKQANAIELSGQTLQWWRNWSSRCSFKGKWQKEVLGSLITLKGLTYQPTGGIVAAATTSLPEHIGGVRNWDYRYCWLRDATFTLYSFLIGGYIEEAKAWRQWLIHAAAGSPTQLQIMYGLAGERRLSEVELDWLPGYENSKPVRIGNAAYKQHQLDVPGEVMEALHLARRFGLDHSDVAWELQRVIMNVLDSVWHKADEGIWEIRGSKKHFTHSKVMAWVAADRAVKDVENFGLPGEVEKWRALRDRIKREVLNEGFNSKLGAFVQTYGSEETDASLLMLPLVGFVEANDPRMIGTIKMIERDLVKDGFVIRYRTESNVDGLPEGEGAFLLCSFWLVDNYALAGRYREARELFEMLLSLRNDVGLLAEEYDPHAKRMLGNFPQAFSHVGLINSARNLSAHGGPAEDRAHEVVN